MFDAHGAALHYLLFSVYACLCLCDVQDATLQLYYSEGPAKYIECRDVQMQRNVTRVDVAKFHSQQDIHICKCVVRSTNLGIRLRLTVNQQTFAAADSDRRIRIVIVKDGQETGHLAKNDDNKKHPLPIILKSENGVLDVACSRNNYPDFPTRQLFTTSPPLPETVTSVNYLSESSSITSEELRHAQNDALSNAQKSKERQNIVEITVPIVVVVVFLGAVGTIGILLFIRHREQHIRKNENEAAKTDGVIYADINVQSLAPRDLGAVAREEAEARARLEASQITLTYADINFN